MYPKDWNTLEFTKSFTDGFINMYQRWLLLIIHQHKLWNEYWKQKKKVEDENTLVDFISFLSDPAASASCSYLVSLQYPSSSHQSTSARTPSKALKQ